METMNTDQLKTLLGLATARVKDTSDALERNWLIQMICAAIGIALVYDIAELTKVICKYFGGQDTCTPRSAATVLIVVQLYYFMKFGQLVTAFLEARQLLDKVLDAYFGEARSSSLLAPVRDSMSFFEGYYSRSAFNSWAPLRAAYFLLFLMVVASGQAAALFLLIHGYGASPASLIIGALAIVALIVLYVGFWYSKKDHLHTTRLVFGCMALVAAGFFIFWRTTV